MKKYDSWPAHGKKVISFLRKWLIKKKSLSCPSELLPLIRGRVTIIIKQA